MLEFILARLKEPSTIRGIIMFFGAMGLTISPELTNSIIAVSMAGAGLVGVATSDG
jgi:hypothetical protein